MDIAIEAEMVPVRDTLLIPRVEAAFDADGSPIDAMTDAAMTAMLDDLEWRSPEKRPNAETATGRPVDDPRADRVSYSMPRTGLERIGQDPWI